MNEKMIAKLESKGFKRWTKETNRGMIDRLYLNAQSCGLEVSYYKTGNVSCAKFNDERISNAEGRRMLAQKTYIDLKDDSIHSDYWNDTFRDIAQTLIDEATAEIEAEEQTEKFAEELASKDMAFTGERVKSIEEEIFGDLEENNEGDDKMENKKWYAVQKTSEDGWDNGSFDQKEAITMLKKQGYGLIAVIVDNFCEEEIKFDDIFDLGDFTDSELAEIVDKADSWNRPNVEDTFRILCKRAGRKLWTDWRDGDKAQMDYAERFASWFYEVDFEEMADITTAGDAVWDVSNKIEHFEFNQDYQTMFERVCEILRIK